MEDGYLRGLPLGESNRGTWRVLVGLAVILLAIVLVQFGPMWGSVLAVAFITFTSSRSSTSTSSSRGFGSLRVVDVTFFS